MTVPYGWALRTGDYSPPEVVATYPVGEEQGDEGQAPVSPDVVLTITFDERLDETRLDEVELTLVGPGGAVSGTLAAQPAIGLQTVLRFTPAESLAEETRYTATVGGAVDLVGNVMAEAYAWVFHTGTAGGGIHSGTAERVRQSYAFGGKPVAIRERVGEVESVYWLHPDHVEKAGPGCRLREPRHIEELLALESMGLSSRLFPWQKPAQVGRCERSDTPRCCWHPKRSDYRPAFARVPRRW